jgi:hypothetical protein
LQWAPVRALDACLGARRRARGDLNGIFAIDLSISVKECTQEWLREVEIGP